jgi:hypothetical protein
MLRLDVAATHLDCIELVATDAPAQDFLLTGHGVERPLAVPLHERDRKRPVIQPNDEMSGPAR